MSDSIETDFGRALWGLAHADGTLDPVEERTLQGLLSAADPEALEPRHTEPFEALDECQRRRAFEEIALVAASDGAIAPEEAQFLAELAGRLQLSHLEYEESMGRSRQLATAISARGDDDADLQVFLKEWLQHKAWETAVAQGVLVLDTPLAEGLVALEGSSGLLTDLGVGSTGLPGLEHVAAAASKVQSAAQAVTVAAGAAGTVVAGATATAGTVVAGATAVAGTVVAGTAAVTGAVVALPALVAATVASAPMLATAVPVGIVALVARRALRRKKAQEPED